MPPLPPEFDIKVVGLTFVIGYPDNLVILADDIENGLQHDPACAIHLRRNPHNRFDSNAVEVRLTDTDAMLGHIPKDVAKRLAAEVDSGTIWEAEIVSVDIHPEHEDNPGLTIHLHRRTTP